MTNNEKTINEEKLHALMGKMVGELGAAAGGVLVIIGQKLGLYKALSEKSISAEGLAKKTNTHPRYVLEWASAQAASGYIEYDKETKEFSMTSEQASVFSDEESPTYMGGGFISVASLYADEAKITEVFKSGEGISWGSHDSCLFTGVAKFFKPTYKAHLLDSWIPSLDGVEEKLKQGIKVADVGCGYGHSTIMLAKRFPKSQFFGFDFHTPSIEQAKQNAKEQNIDNINFEVAKAKDFPGETFGLVTFFDCLHDMGDPAGAAKYVFDKLDLDGTLMIVEPYSGDTLEDNLNPVGRVFYSFSTAVCTPTSMSQEVGLALGAQAGEKKFREVIKSAGFTRIRRASETPFNLVFEVKR